MIGLEDVKLLYGLDEDDGIHGYYRTKEGRDLLRDLYDSFLNRLPYKERKLASIISDYSATDPHEEVETTRSALKRWRNNQPELWWKDKEKSLRVLKRLEKEMMACPPIREILDDRAATIFKLNAASSLSGFFQGVTLERIERNNINIILNKYSGFFREIFTGFDIENEDGIAEFSGKYHRFARVDGAHFLLAQEFIMETEPEESAYPVIKQRCSGFAIPTHDGELHRFVVSHERPRERIHDRIFSWAPVVEVPGLEPDDQYIVVSRNRLRLFDPVYDSMEEYFPRRYKAVLDPVTKKEYEYISRIIDRTLWDMPL